MIADRPQLVVVGGPNGCGKTTFAKLYAQSQGLTYLGADEIAMGLSPADPTLARIKAGREFSRCLSHRMDARDSLVVESTLAGTSLAGTLAQAKADGYLVIIVVVFLDSVELCLHRIAERVAQGGHDVPRQDVMRRFRRVFPMFWSRYRPLADRCLLVFNGGTAFSVVAEANEQEWTIHDTGLWTTFQSFLRAESYESELR